MRRPPASPSRRVLVAVVACCVLAGCGGADKVAPVPKGEHRVDLAGGTATTPDGWDKITDANLQLVEGAPDAALRRRDGTAILSVRRGDEQPAAIGEQQAKLLRELRPRVPDLQGLRATEVRTAAGLARSFTVLRGGPTGLARVVTIPDGDRSYILELAITSTQGTAAKEAGRIIRSFATGG